DLLVEIGRRAGRPAHAAHDSPGADRGATDRRAVLPVGRPVRRAYIQAGIRSGMGPGRPLRRNTGSAINGEDADRLVGPGFRHPSSPGPVAAPGGDLRAHRVWGHLYRLAPN